MQNLAWLSRTELLIGEENIQKLQKAHVLVVGLGGVGSYCAEFIARAGVGKMTIVDGDVVDNTNRNRQLPATVSTIGMSKAEWMTLRIKDINPEIELKVIQTFLTPEKANEIITSDKFNYVVDAIDSITPKLNLMIAAYRNKVKLVSSGGAGGKIDPTQIKIADLSKTYNCVLVKYVRKRLKKENIYKGIKVVFSPEKQSEKRILHTDGSNFKRSSYGTISYMPATFGGVCASVVIRHIIK